MLKLCSAQLSGKAPLELFRVDALLQPIFEHRIIPEQPKLIEGGQLRPGGGAGEETGEGSAGAVADDAGEFCAIGSHHCPESGKAFLQARQRFRADFLDPQGCQQAPGLRVAGALQRRRDPGCRRRPEAVEADDLLFL